VIDGLPLGDDWPVSGVRAATRQGRVRLILRIIGWSAALLVLAMLAGLGDLAFNQRRLFYTLLGRDTLIAACTPALTAKLRAAGFEPTEVALGAEPDITVSTATGRSLQDSFTFQDGAAAARVDGVVACLVKDGAVSVDFRTSASPVRAT
jgi:hypothetical protein